MRSYSLGVLLATGISGVAGALFMADAGSFNVPLNETFQVPDTNVEITNNSASGAGPLLVEWDDESANIRVTVDHDVVASVSTQGTAVAVFVVADSATVSTSGGNVSLAFAPNATNSSATLGDNGNSIAYLAGSSGNTATCTGDGNTHRSETDPDLIPGNTTTFNGQTDVAR